jgi:hypothetical protein
LNGVHGGIVGAAGGVVPVMSRQSWRLPSGQKWRSAGMLRLDQPVRRRATL